MQRPPRARVTARVASDVIAGVHGLPVARRPFGLGLVGQQPSHWSGMLPAIRLLVRVTGLVSGLSKIPPPWGVMPWFALSRLRRMLLLIRVTGPPGGPLLAVSSTAKMPPPWTVPVSALAMPEFPLTVVFCSVTGPPC